MSGSRFSFLTRWQAVLIMLLTVMLIEAGSEFSHSGPPSKAPTPATYEDADLVLYRQFITRVAQGDAYYPMAADELRRGNYPLRPFVAFRLPLLTEVSAALGTHVMLGLLWGLIGAASLAWWVRLKSVFERPTQRMVATLFIIIGLMIATRTELVTVHEIWAGVLITLALALYEPQRFWPALITIFAAVMIRETALPFALLFGVLALWHKRWREALAWAGVMLCFGLVLWFHYLNVSAVTTLADPTSPGWTRFGGWLNYITAMRDTSALRVLPGWLSAIVVPLALLGWASWRSPTGLRGSLLLSGYALMLMIFGRADNFYWGLLSAPLLLLGLIFLPRALLDLIHSASRRAAN